LVQSCRELERWKSLGNARKEEDLPNNQARKVASRGCVGGIHIAVKYKNSDIVGWAIL